jgi:hypothetical protein
MEWFKNLFRKAPVLVAAPSPLGPKVAILDHGCGIPVADLQKYAEAQLIQCNNHFALPPPSGWGLAVQSIRVCDAAHPPLADEWVMGLFVTPDQPGALGYHDTTAAGLPLMKIFPLLDKSQPWTVTASHEMLETLGDPLLRRAAQDNRGRFWAYENCDAVEEDKYQINGVWVSNFVLVPYFEPPAKLTGVKLDWMGLVKVPLEIRTGGYGQYWDSTRGWVMVGPTGGKPARKAKDMRGEHARSARRQKLAATLLGPVKKEKK